MHRFPEALLFHYIFNYNQIERLLERKKNAVVLKEAWHTNNFIALQVENAVIFLFLWEQCIFIFYCCDKCRTSFLESASGRCHPSTFVDRAYPGRGFSVPFSVIGNNLVFYYYLKFYKFHLKFEIPLRVTFSEQLFDDEEAYSF